MLTLFVLPFDISVSFCMSSNPRCFICSSSNSPYKCGTHVFRKRYNSSVRFFGTLNQNSGFNLFLPYDITYVGNGIVFPHGFPILKRKYNGGSAHARAGRGINSAQQKIYDNNNKKLFFCFIVFFSFNFRIQFQLDSH